jgi:hypothetical protein
METCKLLLRLVCSGWTTWHSPSKIPSAKIITARMIISLLVAMDSSTQGCTCSEPGFTWSEVWSWVLAGIMPSFDWSTSTPPLDCIDWLTYSKIQYSRTCIKGAVSRRWLAKINGAKKRLKLMLHDWKRRGNLQFLKQSKDVLHNEGIINSISYFTPNLINCWQTVFQVRAYFGCAVEPWHCPFKRHRIPKIS